MNFIIEHRNVREMYLLMRVEIKLKTFYRIITYNIQCFVLYIFFYSNIHFYLLNKLIYDFFTNEKLKGLEHHNPFSTKPRKSH